MTDGPGENKVVQRDRSLLDLKVLHVEITAESYELIRALAKSKRMSMGGYLDVLLRRKRDKLVKGGFIQSEESAS